MGPTDAHRRIQWFDRSINFNSDHLPNLTSLCDEFQHRGLAYNCDQDRMNQIGITLREHVHFIRYNPDSKQSNYNALKLAVDSAMQGKHIKLTDHSFSVEYLFYS